MESDKWDQKFTLLATHHSQLRRTVDEMSATIQRHELILARNADTQDKIDQMLDIFESVQGGMKVLGWLGVFVKWIWPVIAVIGAVIVYIKTGKLEKI